MPVERMRARPAWIFAVAVLVVLAPACSGDGVKDVTGQTTTSLAPGPPPAEEAAASFRPRFVPSRCLDGVPRDSRVSCGWLVVRADRSERAGDTVRLPVAIVRAAAAERPADPVVYLAGGPGASGLDGTEGFLDTGYAGDRDVVIFDQRGTGAALPNLNCPEVEEAVKATFATADPAPMEQRVLSEGFRRCRARLVGQHVDLADYRTETSADDVEDLRNALGYERVNLYGASYGTALALTVMRRHPAGIRSVTLDGVYPTTVANGPAEVAANARRAIGMLEARCESSVVCRAAAPDLRGAIAGIVDRFDLRPYVGTLTDPASGTPVPVRITGADIIVGVVNSMYTPAAITALPAAISALAAGQDDGIDGVAASGLKNLTGLSEGMAVSVECADRARRPTAAGLEQTVGEDPSMSTLALIGDLGALCQMWGVPPASRSFNDELHSDIPTLLLSGAFDPVTPPSNASAVAAGLPRSFSVTFPAGGHGAVFSSDCADSIFDRFLTSPTRRPVTACATTPASPWERGS